MRWITFTNKNLVSNRNNFLKKLKGLGPGRWNGLCLVCFWWKWCRIFQFFFRYISWCLQSRSFWNSFLAPKTQSTIQRLCFITDPTFYFCWWKFFIWCPRNAPTFRFHIIIPRKWMWRSLRFCFLNDVSMNSGCSIFSYPYW